VSAAAAPPLVPLLIVAATLAAVGVGFYVAYLAEKKRAAALFDAATRMGFSFEAKIAKELLPTLGPFHLFRRGHSQKGKNLMRGKAGGADAIVLDYTYVTGSGKNSQTHNQTVVIYPLTGLEVHLPEFTLGPEHWWDRIGQVFGYQDIDFESSEDFSKHYLLRGPDESAIRAAFGPDVLGFFAQNQGWSVESAGGQLAVYRANKRAKPEEMQPFVAETAGVRRALVRN
jgi:hypothetical protein